MATGQSCVYYPEAPNGKRSKLYEGLLTMLQSRPLVNWIYASYISSNLGDVMEAGGVMRNIQGEHDASEVLQAIDWNRIANEITHLTEAELQLNAVDLNGHRVDYTDAVEALTKASDFNKNHKGLVATVNKYGDVYNIIVSEKNSRTHTYALSVETKLQVWDACKHAFNAVGIDIENMPPELSSTFSAYNADLADSLKNLKDKDINYLYKRDALMLFTLDKNSQEVQRLINSFGSIENAAQAMEDINHGRGGYTKAQKTLLGRAVVHARKMQGVDIDALQAQVEQMTEQINLNDPEFAVKQTLHQLNKKYNININEIHRVSDEIRTWSEAAADTAITLQRQIRQLEKERGNNAEGKKLSIILDQLLRELNSKKYYTGLLSFLNEASNSIYNIDPLILNVSQTGTELEVIFEKAKAIQQIKDIGEQYYPLVAALANDNLIIDESIGQTEINNVRQAAKKLKKYFDDKEEVLKGLAEGVITDLLTQVLKGSIQNGQSITNIVKMAAADSSWNDRYLYSISRTSNPVISAMGSVIRNAQDSRDKRINEIALRIRRATNELYKAGYNSEFMYEDNGHIISDIDWEMYKKARTANIRRLKKLGYVGFDLKEAIEQWEDSNTEERVVDSVSGRKERVPNDLYRKRFPDLDAAQQKYYDTMMQIKGEIGTLLPAYAQKQYLPPQLRRNMVDAITHAKSIKDVGTAIKNKAQNFYKIREDDTNYNMNGIIDGEEYKLTEGAFDNTPLRQIPIFYVNKVEEKELLKDFSAGIQALASTAINYDAMYNVLDVAEFLGDFAKNQTARDKDPKADTTENQYIRIFKDLKKHGRNTNTEAMVDGFIEQHFYGQNQKEKGKGAKMWGNIIGYTSFKGLVTNVPGAVANYLVGEFQMLIEAGAGEFYDFKDYSWAHKKLIGKSGVMGDMAELLTNNMNHKSTLLREMFDPLNDNFSDKQSARYHKSAFRQLLAHDCSFIGYGTGEYLLHYINMYAVLHNTKVLLNGKKINLYDAYELVDKKEGNSELRLKQGVTTTEGDAITDEWLDGVRNKIKYVNQSTHGAMNKEDKGLIHQHWWGRGVMNFRQWMVEHYSRRFRKRHFDAALGQDREGYWRSMFEYMYGGDTKEQWKSGLKGKAKIVGATLGEAMFMAVPWFMRDYMTFMLRAQSQWDKLDAMQQANVKRVHQEMMMYIMLCGLNIALGEPDKHKKEWWRRFFIYQTRRLMMDTETAIPTPKIISAATTVLQSPMAGVNTINSFLYLWYGATNGDLFTTIKSGPHKGENKYIRNVKKYVMPFYKDIEKLEKLGEDESIFKVFISTPTNK